MIIYLYGHRTHYDLLLSSLIHLRRVTRKRKPRWLEMGLDNYVLKNKHKHNKSPQCLIITMSIIYRFSFFIYFFLIFRFSSFSVIACYSASCRYRRSPLDGITCASHAASWLPARERDTTSLIKNTGARETNAFAFKNASSIIKSQCKKHLNQHARL